MSGLGRALTAAALAFAGALGGALATRLWEAPAFAEDSGGRPGAPAATDRHGARVGFVDIQNVFTRYDRKSLLERRYRRRDRQVQEDINHLLDSGKQMEREALRWNDDHPSNREKREEAARLKLQAADRDRAAKAELFDERKRVYRTLYGDVVGAVEAEAKARGYDLILKVDTMDTLFQGLSEEHPDALAARLGLRGVLSYNPADDISEAVIARLNREYATRGEE
ncbi:MAG: OmpH family outer membrane protein [Planctomycetes bacterium]|nr:OmpH family outer membrane protein [Planctomycetota bacterium]